MKWDKKYFITELKLTQGDAPWTPQFKKTEGMRLINLDSNIRDGAFIIETAWFLPGEWPASKGDVGTVKEHGHDYDEVVAYVGTDPSDPYDLNGEVEFWIDGQQNNIDRSFIAFIPSGIPHGPLSIRRIDKPIFHFIAGMAKKYR